VPTSPFEPVLRYATYVVLVWLGVLAGTIGTFLVPGMTVGGFLGLSTLVAVAGNAFLGLLGGFGVGTTAGAAAPLAGWIAVVLAVNVYFPGGDVIIPGALGGAPDVVHAGFAFMIGGVAASIVPIVLTSRYTERVKTPKSLP
jgi:hypothetical protein